MRDEWWAAISVAARVTSFALLLAPPASGAERMPVLPEELAIIKSIVVQDEDELETSLSARHFHLPDGRHTTAQMELEYGVTDFLQAVIEVPYGIRKGEGERAVDGFEDLEVGLRYALLDFRTRPFALDIGLSVGLPTGSRPKELGEGSVSLEPTFTASRWLGRVNGQLGFAWRRSGIGGSGEARNEFEYDVALLYPWRHWFLTFEGAGETRDGETAYYAVPELVWKPGKHLELLVGIPIGLSDAAADYGVIAGIAVEIENLTGRGADVE